MILVCVVLELGQKSVPGREFESRDMFINSLGVLTGIVIGLFASRIGQVSSRNSAD